MTHNNHKELIVWKKAMNLTQMIYKETNSFPKFEDIGLVNQMRRSAVSIPSNIAEGAGRQTAKSFNYFLSIANGSACELETQVMISGQLGYLSKENESLVLGSISEIQKMIFSLRKKLMIEKF